MLERKYWKLLSGVASAAAVLHGRLALAQNERAASKDGLQEIIVTATRREENLMNVPVAVTALQAGTLETRQISDVESLQRIAPSLSAAPFGDGSSPLLTIRGQVAQDIVAAVDPAVGIYIDGVYLGRFTGGNMAFLDVERVEVLRGPQGTLFGRNTIGGAVSITPNHPTDHFEGMVSGRFGNFNALSLTGVLNVPLGDKAAARVVGSHTQHDGYAKSALTGADLNGQNQDYGRASLRVDVADGWRLLASADYLDSHSDGQWFTLLKAFPIGETLAKTVSGGTQTAAQFVGPFSNRPSSQTNGPLMSRNWGSSLVIEGAIGDSSVKSITAYREVNRALNNLDQDATPFEMLQIYRNTSKQHQFSQELQIYGKALDDDLDWIVGAYFFSEKGRDEVISHFVYPLGPNFTITDGTAFNRNLAVFGQATYSITNQIQLVGGIRYARDRRRLDVNSRNAATTNGAPGAIVSCAITGAAVPNCLVPLPNKTFSYVPLTVGLNYKPSSNALIYLKWSRGFRSGGYNTRGVSANTLLPFGPEKVDSYELGAKFEVDHLLRVSGDVFQSDFTDIQILANVAFGPGTTVALSQNAGTARIRGLELEAEAVLAALRLNGSLALLDAKYKKLSPTVVGLVAGSPFAYTPKTTFTLSADYTVSLASTDFVLHADYAWRSRVYFAPVPPNDPLNQQASYGLINASLAAKLANGLTLSVFGKNLANKRYLNRTTSIPTLGFLSGYPGDPRTYGVSAAYRF